MTKRYNPARQIFKTEKDLKEKLELVRATVDTLCEQYKSDNNSDKNTVTSTNNA